MAAYPTKHIYDDDFILISIDMNYSDLFVALNYVILYHILFFMRLNGSYNCSYTGSYVVASHQKSYIRNTRYNHSDLFRS